MSGSPIEVERRGGTLVATLNRPAKLNALTATMYETLGGLSQNVRDDPSIRAIALFARGSAFCAGADLNEVLRRDVDGVRAFEERAQLCLTSLEEAPVPVVAGCRGVAMAGGLELLLVCDIIIASKKLQVGDGHIRYGLIPGGGATQRLPRVIGYRRALELLLTGSSIDAMKALDMGLINEVVPDGSLESRVLELCTQFEGSSRSALRLTKELARSAISNGLADGLARETEASVGHLTSLDAREGLRAFTEKRAPRFH